MVSMLELVSGQVLIGLAAVPLPHNNCVVK